LQRDSKRDSKRDPNSCITGNPYHYQTNTRQSSTLPKHFPIHYTHLCTTMPPKNLFQLLQQAANDESNTGILVHHVGGFDGVSSFLTYRAFKDRVLQQSEQLKGVSNFITRSSTYSEIKARGEMCPTA
jgi:hypothetical protein